MFWASFFTFLFPALALDRQSNRNDVGTREFQEACFIKYHSVGELHTDLKEAKEGLFHV